ncbi:MAG: ABC transporter ATP-binding protein [Proteobacteria bacterium]|nr:ABC transporter ATP-binding protein [Pseudomonadota bacterium]
MNALTIQNLTKTYPNGFTALKGINLTVAEGDFFALLGPNGAGKSTTISITTSLTYKTSGEVKIFGHDIDKEPSLAKSYIGVVPQEFNCNIFETVFNVLKYQAGYYGIPYKIAKIRIEKYLKKLHLWDMRNKTIRTLSGGMKRRVMIARALVHEPKLLILDEPTAGVDIEIRRTMWEFIKEINQQGITVILTTHYLEEAESLCKNIAIIDQGEIIENTSMKALLQQLDVETFILNLSNSITELPQLKNFTTRMIDNTTLEVDVHKHCDDINELFIQLNHHGIRVQSMRNKINRLEELFMRLIKKNDDNMINNDGIDYESMGQL